MSTEPEERCEGCGDPAVCRDSECVPLCKECAEIPDAPTPAKTPAERVEEEIERDSLGKDTKEEPAWVKADFARTLAAELQTANAKVEKLRGVLQSLYEVQNGPPLHKYEAAWRNAMNAALVALAETE